MEKIEKNEVKKTAITLNGLATLRKQERDTFLFAIAGIVLAVMVSPWFVIMAMLGAFAHWAMALDVIKNGADLHPLQHIAESVEELIVEAANKRFDAEGMDRRDRHGRFEIRNLRIQRMEDGGIAARAEIERDDQALYQVRVLVPPPEAEREPGIEIVSVPRDYGAGDFLAGENASDEGEMGEEE